MKDKIYNWIYTSDGRNHPKDCYCVGPENCGDRSCKLVKDYREKHAKT